jgi:urease accessory protein
MLKRLTLSATVLLAATAPAFAHLNPAEHGSVMSGLSHPFSGADHMLAMIAVGIWAAMIGGKAKWIVPSAFVTTMLAGFGLALTGVALPFVEPAILASIVGLGLLVAMAVRLPVAMSAAVVSVFAVFHGFAHGSELGGAAALEFAAGFAVATAVLHGLGLGLGLLVAGRFGDKIARILGAGTAVAGLALAFAA